MRCRRIRSVNCSAHVRNPIPRTCLATMYACGLRIGEATMLEIRSVDRANQVLRVIGKGDKERLVLLPQPVLDELGTLWRTHRNPRWLFPNRCGDGPLNQRVLSHTFAAHPWHTLRIISVHAGGRRAFQSVMASTIPDS